MRFAWDEEKNATLRKQRGVSFEEVVVAISEGRILDILPHHDTQRYPNQMLLIIELRNYVHYVPFVQNESEIFLKNIIPSRKYHKRYKGENA